MFSFVTQDGGMGLKLFPADTSLAELENQTNRHNNSNIWEKRSGKRRCDWSSVGLGLLDISVGRFWSGRCR